MATENKISDEIRAAEATGHTLGCMCLRCDNIRDGVPGGCFTCGAATVGQHVAGNLFVFQCDDCTMAHALPVAGSEADEIEQVILRGLIDRRIEVEGPDFDYADESVIAYARSVRAALERSGRLLPSGGEVNTQYGVLNPRSPFAWAVCRIREDAERQAAALPDDGDYVASRTVTIWGEGHGEMRLVGPWSPVVSDNSEGESSG